jgi:hypothetical protein
MVFTTYTRGKGFILSNLVVRDTCALMIAAYFQKNLGKYPESLGIRLKLSVPKVKDTH